MYVNVFSVNILNVNVLLHYDMIGAVCWICVWLCFIVVHVKLKSEEIIIIWLNYLEFIVAVF